MVKKEFTALVVFMPTGRVGSFWEIFCRTGWGHCFVMVPAWYPEPGLLSTQMMMKVEPLRNHIDVDLVFADIDEAAKEAYDIGATAVLKVKVKVPKPAFGIRGLINCVTVAKGILGIHDFMVFTPYDLFKRLTMVDGAKLVEINQ